MSMPNSPVENSIKESITKLLQPVYFEIQNESSMHNVPKGSESHFKVYVVSELFDDVPLLKEQSHIALMKAAQNTLSRRIKDRISSHPIAQSVYHFPYKFFFGLNTPRDDVQLRKPQRPVLTYKFHAKPSDEDHRLYKLVDGKVEEYTQLPRGWQPNCRFHWADSPAYRQIVFGMAGCQIVIAYIVCYWLAENYLKRFYIRLDRKRIDFERTVEMEEIRKMEREVRNFTSSALGSDGVVETPDFVHPKFPSSTTEIRVAQSEHTSVALDRVSSLGRQDLLEKVIMEREEKEFNAARKKALANLTTPEDIHVSALSETDRK